jgi:hypothetical protein
MATRDTGNKKRGRPPKVAASEAEPDAKKASTKNMPAGIAASNQAFSGFIAS